MAFREDINQLRAVAVLAVVIFHFRPDWLPGGYVGVDVFFVISGYLITQVIVKRLENNTFSFVGFYADRVNRIFPAMLTLALILLVCGWFFFSALDYRYLGKQLVFSLSYLSNFLFSSEAGYFDRASSEKLLLHTWSLAVEWQFYLLYPWLLWIIWSRLSKPACITFVGLGVLGSFSFVFWNHFSGSNGYFLTQTRVWELLAGGLVALIALSVQSPNEINQLSVPNSERPVIVFTNNLFGWSGWVLIIFSIFMLDRETQWPGIWTLLPVVGAALVLYFGKSLGLKLGVENKRYERRGFIASTISSIPTLVGKSFYLIGRSSYSIYIWHWPMAVIGSFYLLPYVRWWGMPVSVLLGFVSYLLIESLPAKIPGGAFRVACFSLMLALALGLFGVFIWRNDGLVDRFDGKFRAINESALEAEKQRSNQKDSTKSMLLDMELPFIEGSSDERILFVGASHIGQMYSYVEKNNAYFDAWFLVRPGCFVVPFESKIDDPCEKLYRFEELVESVKFQRIVVSLYCVYCGIYGNKEQQEQQIDIRSRAFDNWLAFAKQHSNQVYMVTGELFSATMDPATATRRYLPDHISRRDIEKHYHWHHRALQQLKELDGVVVINPLDYLCDGDICPARTPEGDFLHFDHSHMRPQYVRERMTYLQPILEP